MITRGEVQKANNETGIYSDKDTTVLVRIPIFDSTSSAEPTVLAANVMYIPGVTLPLYQAGDMVYVSFIDNKNGDPVVLGKIITN